VVCWELLLAVGCWPLAGGWWLVAVLWLGVSGWGFLGVLTLFWEVFTLFLEVFTLFWEVVTLFRRVFTLIWEVFTLFLEQLTLIWEVVTLFL
jgi:hypothetical protein